MPVLIRRRWAAAMSAMLLLSVIVLPAQAQSPVQVGLMTGTVVDPDERGVADAAIVVRNEGGLTRATSTERDGRFSISGLPAGIYTVDVTASGFALATRSGVRLTGSTPTDLAFALSLGAVSETVNVSAVTPGAARSAPSGAPLDARSATSTISDSFIRNFTAPGADYTQVVQVSPGLFSYSTNGPGLGDTKTFMRGFKDGQYTMTFDGIPFNDTNSATHHSWAFFPSEFVGGAVVDRSPGSAATIGPANYGGSMNLLSRQFQAEAHVNGGLSYSSFNTRLLDAEYESGPRGSGGRSQLILNVHQLTSDGYQTFNRQQRNAFSGKYQFVVSPRTVITAFASYVELTANTPDKTTQTRAALAQFGDNYLMTDDPSKPNYFGYNLYSVPTDFEYAGIRSELGRGWTIDDKVYLYAYHNHQHFNGTTVISATSGTDKLNAYRTVGNLLPVSHSSPLGVFRAGLWSEYSRSNRHQIPTDPRTWSDAAVPNFRERYSTSTIQPYVEYGLKVGKALTVTPGMKLAYYKQDFTQFPDNGGAVGNLNGAASVEHVAPYHSWLPSFDARLAARSNWTLYGQWGKGNQIPPTSVFDVKGAQVTALPEPTLTSTYQAGSVFKVTRVTLDIDAYYINFENSYSSVFDAATSNTIYFANGVSVTKGVELETHVLVGAGLGLYFNGTKGTAQYSSTGQWVASAPRDTETVGLDYQRRDWTVGLFAKRVGTLFNDNANTHQAVTIDPVTVSNLFINYSLGGGSAFSRTKLRLSVNNLFDSHSIVAVTPAAKTTSVAAPGDLLTLLAARSVSLSFSVDFSPTVRRP